MLKSGCSLPSWALQSPSASGQREARPTVALGVSRECVLHKMDQPHKVQLHSCRRCHRRESYTRSASLLLPMHRLVSSTHWDLKKIEGSSSMQKLGGNSCLIEKTGGRSCIWERMDRNIRVCGGGHVQFWNSRSRLPASSIPYSYPDKGTSPATFAVKRRFGFLIDLYINSCIHMC
mgnify:CR=1 FL=1|jgi:hypothetical protein